MKGLALILLLASGVAFADSTHDSASTNSSSSVSQSSSSSSSTGIGVGVGIGLGGSSSSTSVSTGGTGIGIGGGGGSGGSAIAIGGVGGGNVINIPATVVTPGGALVTYSSDGDSVHSTVVHTPTVSHPAAGIEIRDGVVFVNGVSTTCLPPGDARIATTGLPSCY